MTEVLRLSNSEMKLWRCDKRHWYLSIYRRLAKRIGDDPNSAVSIGNRVHDALAAYYDQANSQDPVDYATGVLQKRIEEFPAMEDDLLAEHKLVSAMLSGYLEWLEETGADADLRILGSERMVEIELVPGIHLLSKLDAPVERVSDGARLALEHKTVGNLDQHMPLLKSDSQFLTEHLTRFLDSIRSGMSPDDAMQDCHGVLLNCLKKVQRTAKANPPFYGRTDVPHNIIELRNHWKHCVGIGYEILAARARLDAGETHHTVCPPNATRESTWSNPFLKIYAMMDDGSDYEGALAEMFVESDPLERYLGTEAL